MFIKPEITEPEVSKKAVDDEKTKPEPEEKQALTNIINHENADTATETKGTTSKV